MTPIGKILIIEDDPADYLLLQRHLEREGVEAEYRRIDNNQQLEEALKEEWDLVLSDYRVPGMTFALTLERIKTQQPELPVILVSGSIGEEAAVELLRLGIADFILKDNLRRLVPGIRRTLEETSERRARRRAEQALQESREAALEEQRRARIAALNLMEDAVSARKRIEAVNVALLESEQRLLIAQEGAGIGIWEWDLQHNRNFFSPAFERLYGLEPGSLRDQEQWRALIHPEDLQQIDAQWNETIAHGEPFEVEFRITRADTGETRWLLTKGRARLDDQGKPVRLSGINMDISERKRTEEHLLQAAAVYESSRDGILITDAEVHILAVNRAFTRMTGYTEQELIGNNPRLLQSGRHKRSFYQQMWASVHSTGGWSGEVWNRRKDNNIYPEWLSISAVRDGSGKIINYVGVVSDLSQLKRSEEELEHLSNHDPLTDLANRRLLDARLGHAIDQAGRRGYALAVLLLDIDRFKDINDSLGLDAGDQLLQETARRILDCVRREDTVARLSGDEFVVVLEGLANPQQAADTGEKILRSLRTPYRIDGQELFLTASLGISLFPENGSTAEMLIRTADTAVHRAKEEGRNRTHFYSEALSHAATERLTLETGLRHALEQGELELHYQPQLRLSSGSLAGVEALIRWRHPDRGMIPPYQFIPLAESSDLIDRIGEWVLEEACRQLALWRDAGLYIPRVSVNLSAHQLGQENLPDTVSRILQWYRLPPEALELELTETAIMRDPEHAEKSLRGMAEMGIELAVDDFGTGYSSLAYLQRLHMHRLKIDQTFVQNLPGNSNNAAICRAVIAMANSLGMETVAEGVEEEIQQTFLTDECCDIGQGWLYAKAMPAAELEDWVSARSKPTDDGR